MTVEPAQIGQPKLEMLHESTDRRYVIHGGLGQIHEKNGVFTVKACVNGTAWQLENRDSSPSWEKCDSDWLIHPWRCASLAAAEQALVETPVTDLIGYTEWPL